jgi:uncharacterized protein
MLDNLTLIAVCLGAIAFLYACVGHAGASGYIAVLALFGIHATTIKPVALILNILVAAIGSWQFWRSGYFSWKLFYPFALLSVPMAFVGGYLQLPTLFLKPLLGVILILSALWFWRQSKTTLPASPPQLPIALLIGGGIGLLAGLTGTGGGIFLTPTLLWRRWAAVKQTAAISAAFILVNSLAGLVGYFRGHEVGSIGLATGELALFCLAVMMGGTLGAYLGSNRFSVVTIKRILGVVLAIAGIKLIFN